MSSAPRSQAALLQAAHAALQAGAFDSACQLYAEADAQAALDATALCNFGAAHLKRGESAAAETVLRRAIARAPDLAEAHHNLGKALEECGDLQAAEASYREALRLDPSRHRSAYALGTTLLAQGRWDEAWPHFERRLQAWPVAPELPFPRWDGRMDRGKALLLHAEQGLGDTIQFSRFARFLAEQGMTVVLQVQPRLVTLLSTIGHGVQVISAGRPVASRRLPIVWAPLLSVPARMGMGPGDIPRYPSYLSADAGRIARWREHLPASGRLIGIAWQGNPAHPADGARSFSLESLAPVSGVPDVRLVSLQKDQGKDQLRSCSFNDSVLDPADPVDEGADGFVDSAAILRIVETLVTPDSALAHLAGALGVPAVLCLGSNPDWRWRDHSHPLDWYPGVRLLRQDRAGNWAGLFQRLARELRDKRPRGTPG